MKCKKCGYDFEGVFCPECGTKNTTQEEKNNSERNVTSIEKRLIEQQLYLWEWEFFHGWECLQLLHQL